MAKVTQPLGSSEARGAVGGYVYNTWRGISTVRTRVKPKAKAPGRRETMRDRVIAAARHWSSISDDQRRHWQEYALEHLDPDWTGNDTRLPGFHWHVRINTRRQCLFLAMLDEPPTIKILGHISDLHTASFEDEFQLWWTHTILPDQLDYYVDVWLTGPLTAGRSPTIHDAKWQGYPLYPTDSFATLSLLPGYYTYFARVIHEQGVVTPWQSARGYWAGWP
jgi:hypothetical protein